MRRITAFLLTALVSIAVLSGSAGSAAPARLVAIGDIHGAYDTLVSLLRSAGLVDVQNRWRGGKTVLVQTGDMMDRGAGVRQVIDLLMALEPQASRAGGRVEVLLGNHEMMNLVGNTRDATEEIFAAFGGYAEYRQALRPEGRYGRWLRSKSIAVKVQDTLLMHAGLSPEQAAESLNDVNRRARADLKAWDEGVKWLEGQKLVVPNATMQEVVQAAQAHLVTLEEKRVAGTLAEEDLRVAQRLIPLTTIVESSLFAAEGPMWFRGYATWTDEEGPARAAVLLKRYGVKRIVSGHSPLKSGRIASRFGGTVLLIDTGMLGPPHYGSGRGSALDITGDTITAIYGDERIPLK